MSAGPRRLLGHVPTSSGMRRRLRRGTPSGCRSGGCRRTTPTREHAPFCHILERDLFYEQASGGELAYLEMTARRLQLLEVEVVEQSFKPNGNAKRDKDKGHVLYRRVDNNLFLGLQEIRSNVRVWPLLSTWIVDDVKIEAAVAEERTKARDERALRQ